jgi:hypothetical protein
MYFNVPIHSDTAFVSPKLIASYCEIIFRHRRILLYLCNTLFMCILHNGYSEDFHAQFLISCRGHMFYAIRPQMK